MKKTLFVASLLACALPVLADSGLTLPGEGIANNCTWNLYATFDSLAYTDTFTTLATVNLNNNTWPAIYAVGYTYSSADNTLTLGMASYANPNSWKTLSLGSVTLGADMPVSFALSHSGSNEGGNDTVALRGATGNTTTNFTVSDPVNYLAADRYTGQHISSVSLGTAATSTRIYNQNYLVLTPATGTNVNLVGARLEHEAYSKAAFEEFVLEEKPFANDEIVRYTTVENGNQKNVYSYGTANGEVTFNPDKFDESGKLTLNNSIDLTARTTFIVDDNKTVTIGANKPGTNYGSAFGRGELVKSGGGTLEIRLNDVNRNIDNTVKNDFGGSVTVEEGTLYLFHVGDSDRYSYLGGGDNCVITVKEGATLEMADNTRISIPLGAHDMKGHGQNVVIDGGAVHINANEEYGISAIDRETSIIRDVIINSEGLNQVDKEVRSNLIVQGITIYDSENEVDIKNTDIIAHDVYFDGHTVIDNTTIYAEHGLASSAVGATLTDKYSLEVKNNSQVVYGAQAWGHVDNVYVDKTSALQTVPDSPKGHDDGGALMILGECKLDVADISPKAGESGLAVRTDGTVQAIHEGTPLTLNSISYITEQLSGDMLIAYEEYPDIHGTLNLHLKDDASVLPDAKNGELMNTVFTLTLANFDSSLLIKEGDTEGYLREDVANLTIDAFKDTVWHLVYGRYDAETNNTIFTFSQMEHLEITTPEPATATLSLLALAALASRRRRH